MKKISLIISFLIVAAMLVGCQLSDIDISENLWIFDSAMTNDSAKLGYNIAERADASKDQSDERVKYITCTLSASDGKLQISDETNSKSFVGTYSLQSRQVNTLIYKITVDGTVGTAVLSTVTYANGSSEETLILSLSGCTMTFFTK